MKMLKNTFDNIVHIPYVRTILPEEFQEIGVFVYFNKEQIDWIKTRPCFDISDWVKEKFSQEMEKDNYATHEEEHQRWVQESNRSRELIKNSDNHLDVWNSKLIRFLCLHRLTIKEKGSGFQFELPKTRKILPHEIQELIKAGWLIKLPEKEYVPSEKAVRKVWESLGVPLAKKFKRHSDEHMEFLFMLMFKEFLV